MSSRRKFTPEQVVEIRDLHLNGATQPAIGKQYGVSKVTIHNIVHRLIYKDVL
jgi:transposase